jgi:predicted DNA-binding transcriptional regulator AlpA
MIVRDVEPALLRADEAAALIGVSKRTWWRLVADRIAPQPLRIGGAVRWRRDDIANWILAGCLPTVARRSAFNDVNGGHRDGK